MRGHQVKLAGKGRGKQVILKETVSLLERTLQAAAAADDGG
jgi:hypothetical protein